MYQHQYQPISTVLPDTGIHTYVHNFTPDRQTQILKSLSVYAPWQFCAPALYKGLVYAPWQLSLSTPIIVQLTIYV